MIINAVAVPVKVDRISLNEVSVVSIQETAVLLEMGNLLHNVDPGHTVAIPYGILLEAARVQALGDKVRAVSAPAFIAVIRRIVIDAVFVRIRDRTAYVVVISCRCRCSHHLQAAVFGDHTEVVCIRLSRLSCRLSFLFHPVKILIRVADRRDLPVTSVVTAYLQGEIVAIGSCVHFRIRIRCVTYCHPLINVKIRGSIFKTASCNFDPGNQSPDHIVCGHDKGCIFSLSLPFVYYAYGKSSMIRCVACNVSALFRFVIFEIVDKIVGFITKFVLDHSEIGIHLLRRGDDFFVFSSHGMIIEISDRLIKAGRSF